MSNLEIGELDLAIKQLPNGRSPGPDGLTAEFYKCFWSDLRDILFLALSESIELN